MKLSHEQIALAMSVDHEDYIEDADNEVFRQGISRKEIRSKGERDRGEIVMHDGKSISQVRKW